MLDGLIVTDSRNGRTVKEPVALELPSVAVAVTTVGWEAEYTRMAKVAVGNPPKTVK